MKRSRLIAVLVGFMAIVAFANTASAYYHPGMGRFTSRDPGPARVGSGGMAAGGQFVQRDPYADGMNLYQYVQSNPATKKDPSGLKPDWELYPPAPEDPYEKWQREAVEKFMTWYKAEQQNMGWLAGLPNCPCALQCVVASWPGWWVNTVNPNPAVWHDATTFLYGYHPGAKRCIRSKGGNTAGAAQQCCYDEHGILITHGPGAGTPDRSSIDIKNFGAGGHQQVDVRPFDLARTIMAWKDPDYPGDYEAMYREVRPPNNGNNCPKNP